MHAYTLCVITLVGGRRTNVCWVFCNGRNTGYSHTVCSQAADRSCDFRRYTDMQPTVIQATDPSDHN